MRFLLFLLLSLSEVSQGNGLPSSLLSEAISFEFFPFLSFGLRKIDDVFLFSSEGPSFPRLPPDPFSLRDGVSKIDAFSSGSTSSSEGGASLPFFSVIPFFFRGERDRFFFFPCALRNTELLFKSGGNSSLFFPHPVTFAAGDEVFFPSFNRRSIASVFLFLSFGKT